MPLDFPITIATVPYRIPNSSPPPIEYGNFIDFWRNELLPLDFCANHVEGGKYISPEFRLGQVYDGEGEENNREEEVSFKVSRLVERSTLTDCALSTCVCENQRAEGWISAL